MRGAAIATVLSQAVGAVAMAAPRTPRPRPKIKMGSRIMLMTAPMTVVSILVLAKPCVVMKGFMPSTSSTNTEPHLHSGHHLRADRAWHEHRSFNGS